MTPTPYDPPSTVVLLLALAAWLFAALIAGAVATGRGRDGALWMLAGFVFGPFAILPPLIFERPKP